MYAQRSGVFHSTISKDWRYLLWTTHKDSLNYCGPIKATRLIIVNQSQLLAEERSRWREIRHVLSAWLTWIWTLHDTDYVADCDSDHSEHPGSMTAEFRWSRCLDWFCLLFVAWMVTALLVSQITHARASLVNDCTNSTYRAFGLNRFIRVGLGYSCRIKVASWRSCNCSALGSHRTRWRQCSSDPMNERMSCVAISEVSADMLQQSDRCEPSNSNQPIQTHRAARGRRYSLSERRHSVPILTVMEWWQHLTCHLWSEYAISTWLVPCQKVPCKRPISWMALVVLVHCALLDRCHIHAQ